jgi:endonuclease YncB( thermonuclease family)
VQTGLLHIAGTIRTEQLWPQGDSDADTLKMFVGDNEKAFQFRASPFDNFAPTQVFRKCEVQGITKKQPINAQGEITIRLQGIDAPELHYLPKRYRQNLAETSTLVLSSLLQSVGDSPVPCRAFTYVAQPDDVCDIYARVIADVLVMVGKQEISLNKYLVENGYAFPAFYTSLYPFEILPLTKAAKKAKRRRLGVWGENCYTLVPFNPAQTLRRGEQSPSGDNVAETPPVAEGEGDNIATAGNDDTGPANFPKLFRRQCSYETKNLPAGAGANGEFTGTLMEYLRQSNDKCYETKKFLEKGMYIARPDNFSDFFDDDCNLLAEPWDIIFTEKPSKLVGEVEW